MPSNRAESLCAHVVGLVDGLDAILLRYALGIILLAWIPDRKEHDLFAVREFLHAEVAVAEAAGHEVTAGCGLLDGELVVEPIGFWGGVEEVDGASGAGRIGGRSGQRQEKRKGDDGGVEVSHGSITLKPEESCEGAASHE